MTLSWIILNPGTELPFSTRPVIERTIYAPSLTGDEGDRHVLRVNGRCLDEGVHQIKCARSVPVKTVTIRPRGRVAWRD